MKANHSYTRLPTISKVWVRTRIANAQVDATYHTVFVPPSASPHCPLIHIRAINAIQCLCVHPRPHQVTAFLPVLDRLTAALQPEWRLPENAPGVCTVHCALCTVHCVVASTQQECSVILACHSCIIQVRSKGEHVDDVWFPKRELDRENENMMIARRGGHGDHASTCFNVLLHPHRSLCCRTEEVPEHYV